MADETDPSKPLSDKDLPLDEDVRDDDEPELVRCPYCDKLIYEETVKCPHCEAWIVDRPSNERLRSKWFWPIIIAIGVVMILVTLVARLVR